MHFLLLTVFFLEIFVGYIAPISGEFSCEDGEEYDSCRSPCETTCDNIRRETQNNCSRSCISGCFCRRGLVRADDHTCVPPFECIKPTCQENEEYLDCGSPCARNCTNLNNIFCTKPCYRGCFCKPDFVRDSRGRCIDPRHCRLAGNVRCTANEEYVSCIDFCNNCFVSEYCQTPYCTPGCDCKPGYFRSNYGHCITEDQCIAEEHALQQQCGLNEFYTSCVNPCNDCYSKGRCDDYSNKYCSSGCDCKSGFFRNDDGICIPEWNCLRPKQPVCLVGEEYYDCIPTCNVTCETYNIADVICDRTCNRGCFCKRDFVRRADGLCIPPSECPARPLRCPQGEILYQCLPTCRTTCRTLNTNRELCSSECRQGCFCQPGFVRNDFRICVPASECPSVCGPNREFRTCGSACPATCENFRERKGCPQQRCLRGCFCKAGFVLGPRGNCIRLRDCPVRKPTPCCPGLFGRKSGNETDDEETTPAVNITTTIISEAPSSDSSNATSDPTKPSENPEKVSDKTTPKSEGSTTPLKSEDSTTPLKPVGSTTPLKSGSSTTPKLASGTTTPNSVSSTTTSKLASETTTPKSVSSMPTPKSETNTTPSKAAADTTSEVPTTKSTKNKTEPRGSSTKAPGTSAASTTENQTNNAELTTITDITNSTTANSTAKP